jgi:methylated-DNA-protein-cysteine methyltransferase-like protein
MPGGGSRGRGRGARTGKQRSRAAGYVDRVRAVVRRIPAGQVASYGRVASAAGFPGTARQVARALRGASRIPGLPWHRVLGAGGRILLRGAAGIEQRLCLETEGVAFTGNRVRMDRHSAALLPARESARKASGKRKKRSGSQVVNG